MSPSTRTQVAAGYAAVTALVGTALGVSAGNASAAPVPVVHEFVYTFNGSAFSGDPWPFSVEALRATTGIAPGVTRLAAGPLCNAIVTTTCAGYSLPITVTWLNVSTGRTGRTVVTGSGTDVKTGTGAIALAGQIGPYPLFPNLGVVRA